MSNSSDAIGRLQSYLDDYGHTQAVQEQYAATIKRERRSWRRQKVKSVVADARRCGVLPASWFAWLLIKLAVEAFLKRYLFGAGK